MRYFIDTEFIEGFHKPLFGKRRHFIDLISIGIVSEDGRSFYRLSKDYDYNDANEWVKKNVILKAYQQTVHGDYRNRYTVEDFHKYFGQSNIQIAQGLYQFITCPKGDTVSFYGYYSDYDWVLFCSLFGRMIDLPKGFPMYCIDLKQTLSELAVKTEMECADIYFRDKPRWENNLERIKRLPEYPKQTNEHSALADARWNKELFDFLNKLTNANTKKIPHS